MTTAPQGPNERFRRAAVVCIYEVGDRLVVLDPQGRGHALTGDSAELARVVLEHLQQPRGRAELYDHLAVLSGAPLGSTVAVDDLLALLLGARAIERADAAPHVLAHHGPQPRVVVGITGAVAAMHAPAVVAALLERGHAVRVAATHEALRFVRAEGLEALTHTPVVADMWPPQSGSPPSLPVPHIGLAQWADGVLVWPASATTIGRIAGGDFSSIVAAVALSASGPVMLAPSMNPVMFASAAVRRNLARLVDDGFHVAHPTAAFELAERPEERRPLLGGAPPPAVIVPLFEMMLRQAAMARPRDAEDWDTLWRRDEHTLPWHRDEPDADMVALAASLPAPASVLEIGAGLGMLAVACAALGHRVVATDLSPRAIERARARTPDANVLWIEDDITRSRLHGRFDLILDRGCAHLLGDEPLRAYAERAARLLDGGARLVIKALGSPAAPGIPILDAARARTMFGAAFELDAITPTTMPGPAAAPPAMLLALRRRAT